MRQETVYQQIAVEEYGDQDRAGDGGHQKVFCRRMVDQGEDQGAKIHQDKNRGSGKGKYTFSFFHVNHPLHLN